MPTSTRARWLLLPEQPGEPVPLNLVCPHRRQFLPAVRYLHAMLRERLLDMSEKMRPYTRYTGVEGRARLRRDHAIGVSRLIDNLAMPVIALASCVNAGALACASRSRSLRQRSTMT